MGITMSRVVLGYFSIIFSVSSAVAQTSAEKLTKVWETLIFLLQEKHAHACSLLELSNGDMLAAWYYGSGERNSDDVKILGSRLRKGTRIWSDTFLLADSPGLPDCNPVLFMNGQQKLFLVWIAIEGNMWEYSILRLRTSID